MYVFQRNKEDCEDECEIVFRDHHFNVRNIPRSRPKHRSLSMYLLDMERQHELELFEQLYNSTDADARERRNTHLEFIKDHDKGVNTQASDIAELENKIDLVTSAETIIPSQVAIHTGIDCTKMLETSKKKYGRKYKRTTFDKKSVVTPKLYAMRQDKRREFNPVQIPSRLEDLEVKDGEKILLSDNYRNRRKKGKKPDKFEIFSQQFFGKTN